MQVGIEVDFFVDRILSKAEIKSGLATLFGVSKDKVVVLKDIADLNTTYLEHVICLTWLVKGHFLLHLRVSTGVALPLSWDRVYIVERLCREWGCTALTPDETTPAPMAMWLVDESSNRERVAIDLEIHDDGVEYEVPD